MDPKTPEAPPESIPIEEAPPPEALPVLSPLDLLREAKEKREPVPGVVVSQRGSVGLDVDLGGGFVVLCPMDEVDLRHQKNPGKLVGQQLLFQVKEATPEEILLSQRRQLAIESDVRALKARERATPGAVLTGKVVRIRPHGVYVDIGGIEGFIRRPDLAEEAPADPGEAVTMGEEIQVKVLEIRHDPVKGDRILVSRKALLPSAWERATEGIAVGQKLSGKILRVMEWGGLLVELLPGVTGRVRREALSPEGFPRPEGLTAGDSVEVEVVAIHRETQKISLRRLPGEKEVAEVDARRAARRAERERAKLPAHERLSVGEIVEATIDRLEPYGAFVKIAGGGRGMIHVSEAALGKDETLEKALPPGTKLRVAVIEIATEPSPRIRLSRAAVSAVEGGQKVESYLAQKALLAAAAPRHRPLPPRRERRPAPEARGERRPRDEGRSPREEKPGKLGTLGDLFKAKLAAKKG